jgi:hypothetical protein
MVAPFVVSLSNHERSVAQNKKLRRSSFDKLRTNVGVSEFPLT